MEASEDPQPGIRAVLSAAFMSGIAVGLMYLLVSQGPAVFAMAPLEIFAGALAIGTAGLLLGTMCGLLYRVSVRGLPSRQVWLHAVIISIVVSGSLGLWLTKFAVEALNAH